MKIFLQNNCKFLIEFEAKIKSLFYKGFRRIKQNIVTRLEKVPQKIW